MRRVLTYKRVPGRHIEREGTLRKEVLFLRGKREGILRKEVLFPKEKERELCAKRSSPLRRTGLKAGLIPQGVDNSGLYLREKKGAPCASLLSVAGLIGFIRRFSPFLFPFHCW